MDTNYYNMEFGGIANDGTPYVVYPKTKTSNVFNSSKTSLDTIINNLNDAISGKASSNHNHDNTYLKLSGGTLTGQLTSRSIIPSSSLSYSLGSSSSFFNYVYARYLRPGTTGSGYVGSSSYKYSSGYINTLYTTGGSVASGNGCAVNGGQVYTAINNAFSNSKLFYAGEAGSSGASFSVTAGRTYIVITGHNSTANLNNIYMVRPNGQVWVMCSAGTSTPSVVLASTTLITVVAPGATVHVWILELPST